MPHRRFAPLLCLAALACGNPAAPNPCESPSHTIEVAQLPGSYDVAFTRDGRVISGRLSLVAMHGALDVDRDALGATAPGDPTVVGAWVTWVTGSPSVVLRVGSAANDSSGALLFDGAYFSMFVERIDEAGLSGSWRSSSALPMASEAGGRFCATRL